ncbi:MAG: tetratricopeptide repeat protein [Labilithrix sp.]|nr:tetratricopeptide repeat protein [Labilithrix sp.]MCW5816376.1 tetratricopeptide repeat protein [Labilithrix sp.]
MRSSQSPPFPYGDFGDDPPHESRRLTPSIGLLHDSDQPNDSSNEDFLFHLYRGSELLQDNRVHEAKEELERALHLQPRDSKGQDLIAVVYFRLGLYPRAIQIYEALRRRNANDTSLLLNLALCYLKTGQPQLARRDLEQLLSLNPGHSRAWGYLGLACERLGDLAQAERAFEQGGHAQMAKRMAARREEAIGHAPPAAPTATGSAPSSPRQEIRDVAGAAYQELDAGELSFALAEPTSDKDIDDPAAASWRPHELGTTSTISQKPETQKPDTKDGPPAPAAPAVPQLGRGAQQFNRRPTLIAPVGAPPAYGFLANELASLERIPSQKPPSFGLDDAGSLPPVPSLRRPVVAVPSPFGPAKSHEQQVADDAARTRTLAPPLGHGSAPPQGPGSRPPEEPAADDWEPRPQVTAPPPQQHEEPAVTRAVVGPSGPPPQTPLGIGPPAPEEPPAPVEAPAPKSLSMKPETTRSSGSVAPMSIEPRQARTVVFPTDGVVLHPSGLALARTTPEVGFVARLEAFRAQQTGLKMALLERHVKGKPNGESFGGVASPMVHVTGEGELVLGARPGRKLHAYPIDEMCFAREDVLLGFGGGTVDVAFENGRLTTGEGEHLPVVQLRGNGAVLIEAIGDVVALAVHSERSLSVRREAILGWFGRLVPRAVAPSDAPCGQRGLVSFAGEGRVLLAGA